MAPNVAGHVQRRVGQPQGEQAADHRQRLGQKDQERQHHRAELEREHDEHQQHGNHHHGPETAERLLLLAIMAAQLPAVARLEVNVLHRLVDIRDHRPQTGFGFVQLGRDNHCRLQVLAHLLVRRALGLDGRHRRNRPRRRNMGKMPPRVPCATGSLYDRYATGGTRAHNLYWEIA
jgi:hypothetical protein